MYYNIDEHTLYYAVQTAFHPIRHIENCRGLPPQFIRVTCTRETPEDKKNRKNRRKTRTVCLFVKIIIINSAVVDTKEQKKRLCNAFRI